MSRSARTLFWAIFVVVLIGSLWLLGGVLLPFVAGLLVAYFLDPLVDRVETVGLGRMAATWVVTILFFGALVVGLAVLAPYVQSRIGDFIDRLPEYVRLVREEVLPQLDLLWRRLPPEVAERIQGMFATAEGEGSRAAGMIASVLTGLMNSVMSIANIVSLMLITPVVSFYLLRDWDTMIARIDGWVPVAGRDVVRRLAKDMDRGIAGLVRGQTLLCLILGTWYSLGLVVIGLDLAVPIGMAAGILSFVPFVGFISGFALSVGFALLQFGTDWHVIAAGAIFLAGQGIETLLQPPLVGNRVGLHPVWIIFALMVGGALFGLVGVLVALPAAVCVAVLVRYALERYLASALYDPRPAIDQSMVDGTVIDATRSPETGH
ncbi:AI-2E family transporter [Tistrella bauzanensis]|uniref:AI-2E family transporter n=1 Tax=Tistrella bauzanensis TaxID=657419 RepID=A0ABQ1J1Z0_9PROT|nr:AI-2E family transporter [Tistrella bauzanensis]GGB58137.1 AI-2E family transporter [Tistrella bauzanensis]